MKTENRKSLPLTLNMYLWQEFTVMLSVITSKYCLSIYVRCLYLRPSRRNYPICAEFRSWTPPETLRLPSHWSSLQRDNTTAAPLPTPLPMVTSVSNFVKARDQICAITGDSSRLHASHLVPKAENDFVCSRYRLEPTFFDYFHSSSRCIFFTYGLRI